VGLHRRRRASGGASLTRIFLDYNRLDAGYIIDDGFQDAGPGVDPVTAGSRLVVDRRRDAALTRCLERCRKKLRKAKDEPTQAMVLALLVSDTCGRSGTFAQDLIAKHTRLASEQRNNDTGELLLGNLLGDRIAGAERRGKQPPTGAALVPHRALLFKVCADWLELLECSLERRPGAADAMGLHCTATWNVVNVSSTPCVVDLMFDPGALYEEGSAKATEYKKLLAEAEDAALAVTGADVWSTARLPAPSSREKSNVAGIMPRPPWHVEPWELEIQRSDRIGRGGFGEVFHARWAGTHVAVKEIKDTTPTDADVVDFMLEIALLSQLNHPNIVRFWRGCTEIHDGRRSLLMVTEYVKQGGLSLLLHGHGGPPLPENLTLAQALSFGLDIARGVQYLHSQRILHLDLKSPNVLCAPVWTAKLCDFGLAKIRGESQTNVNSTLQGVSPVWAPPEMFDDAAGGLTEKVDVYSIGVILFELLTKRVPFSEVSAAMLPGAKMAGKLPVIPESVPAECAELIKLCCASLPRTRPSMSGVVARIKEIAQLRNVNLNEVRPPASLCQVQEQRVQDAEASAAQKLVAIDGQRAQLRTELNEMQQKIEAVRRRSAELNAAAGPDAAGPADAPRKPTWKGDDDSWTEPFVQEVAGSKFRCGLCSKLFRGPEFVRRHVVAKHRAEVRRLAEDAFFDCDVSHEDTLPTHQSIPIKEESPTAGGTKRTATLAVVEGRFSQALQDAAERGDAAQIATLLGLRADPGQSDDGGVGPLALAARGGHLEAAQTLLDAAAAGAPDKGGTAKLVQHASGFGLTPLHMAASEGHFNVISMLLGLNAAVETEDTQGKTPLLHAGENGHAEACKLLIEAKANAGTTSSEGETLMHVAARFGDPELIQQVVSWKADLHAQDREGWTPLHEAAHWGAVAVEVLCSAKADVMMRSRDGETALHVALEGYEPVAACEALLRCRADPSAPDVDGETALHVAARRSNEEVCQVLLAAGAQANAEDGTGRRPLDLAKEEEVRVLLLNHGAQPGATSD